MSLLTRYLVRNNLFLLFVILLIGTGLYVLTDLFERLDYFLVNHAAAKYIKNCDVDMKPRTATRPTDHAGLMLEIA